MDIILHKNKEYSLEELVKLQIPWIKTYSVAYLTVTIMGPDGKEFANKTTREKIKPYSEPVRPGSKKKGKIYIKAEDISQYLKLNDIDVMWE